MVMDNVKVPNKKNSFKSGNAILTILFFISIGLTIWGINIYRLTIIDLKYLFAAITLGIIITFATLTFLVKSSYSLFWAFLIKSGIGGGVFYFGLLFLNQQFANKELLTEDFKILKTGTLAGGKSSNCYQPYVTIDFYGTQKEFVFLCDYSEVIKHSTKINLTYSKGAFGFNIIKSKQFKE